MASRSSTDAIFFVSVLILLGVPTSPDCHIISLSCTTGNPEVLPIGNFSTGGTALVTHYGNSSSIVLNDTLSLPATKVIHNADLVILMIDPVLNICLPDSVYSPKILNWSVGHRKRSKPTYRNLVKRAFSSILRGDCGYQRQSFSVVSSLTDLPESSRQAYFLIEQVLLNIYIISRARDSLHASAILFNFLQNHLSQDQISTLSVSVKDFATLIYKSVPTFRPQSLGSAFNATTALSKFMVSPPVVKMFAILLGLVTLAKSGGLEVVSLDSLINMVKSDPVFNVATLSANIGDVVAWVANTVPLLYKNGLEALSPRFVSSIVRDVDKLEIYADNFGKFSFTHSFTPASPEGFSSLRMIDYHQLMNSTRSRVATLLSNNPLASSSDKSFYVTLSERLCRINDKYIVYIKSQAQRKQPFAISFTGPPGVGKTQFTNWAFRMYADTFDIPYSTSLVYNYADGCKHWDGFSPEKIFIVFDDVRTKKVTGGSKEDATLSQFMRVVGNSPFVPLMADLASKGTCPCFAECVVVTSNDPMLGKNRDLVTPEALDRRIQLYVSISVKPMFAGPNGKLRTDASQVALDYELPLDDYWILDVSSSAPDAPNRAVVQMSAKDFLLHYRDKIVSHEAQQRHMQARYADNICTQHHLPFTMCNCSVVPQSLSFVERHLNFSFTFWGCIACFLYVINQAYSYAVIYFSYLRLSVFFSYYCLGFLALPTNLYNLLFSRYSRLIGSPCFLYLADLLHRAYSRPIRPGMIRALLLLSATLTTAYFASCFVSKFFMQSDTANDVEPDDIPDEPTPTGFPPSRNIWARSGAIRGFSSPSNSLTTPNALHKQIARLHITPLGLAGSTVSVESCMALHVHGNVVVTSAHAFDPLKSCGATDFTAKFTWSGSNGISSFQEMRLHLSDVHFDLDNDLAFFHCKSMLTRSSVSSFLPTEANTFLSPHNTTLVTFRDNSLVVIPVTDPSYCYSPTQSKLKGLAVTYNCNAIQGDSGGVLITQTRSSGGFAIVGIHNGRYRDSTRCVASAVFATHFISGVGSACSSQTSNCNDDAFILDSEHAISDNLPLHVTDLLPPDKHDPLTGYDAEGPYEDRDPLLVSGVTRGYAALGRVKQRPKPPNSSVAQSPVKSYIDPLLATLGITPDYVAPDLASYVSIRSFLKNISKRRNLMCPTRLMKVTRAFATYVLKFLPLSELSILGVESDHVALNGRDGVVYCDPMDFSKSAGFPYNKPKSDILTFRIDSKGRRIAALPKHIKEVISECEASLAQGFLPGFVYEGFRKDECIDRTKAMSRGPRLILGCCLENHFLCRKYLMTFARLMQRNRFLFRAACGMNCFSSEWRLLHDYLHTNPNFLAGDYANYDQSLLQILLYHVRVFMLTICIASGKYTRDELYIISGLICGISNPIVLLDGYLYQIFGTNPSGQPLTTYTNCISNVLLLAYVFDCLYPDDNFFENIALMTYGDDNIMSVPDRFPEFNYINIARILSSFGISYTSADKSAVSKRYDPFSDITFLKRSFAFDEAGRCLCPREAKSILKSFIMFVKSRVVSVQEQIAGQLCSIHFELPTISNDVLRLYLATILPTIASDLGISYSQPDFAESYDEASADFDRAFSYWQFTPHLLGSCARIFDLPGLYWNLFLVLIFSPLAEEWFKRRGYYFKVSFILAETLKKCLDPSFSLGYIPIIFLCDVMHYYTPYLGYWQAVCVHFAWNYFAMFPTLLLVSVDDAVCCNAMRAYFNDTLCLCNI